NITGSLLCWLLSLATASLSTEKRRAHPRSLVSHSLPEKSLDWIVDCHLILRKVGL
ncbi:hypothetical protein BaRGS_00012680, partial [Batillaria attramentaria]